MMLRSQAEQYRPSKFDDCMVIFSVSRVPRLGHTLEKCLPCHMKSCNVPPKRGIARHLSLPTAAAACPVICVPCGSSSLNLQEKGAPVPSPPLLSNHRRINVELLPHRG